jgi:hypothetical protein
MADAAADIDYSAVSVWLPPQGRGSALGGIAHYANTRSSGLPKRVSEVRDGVRRVGGSARFADPVGQPAVRCHDTDFVRSRLRPRQPRDPVIRRVCDLLFGETVVDQGQHQLISVWTWPVVPVGSVTVNALVRRMRTPDRQR